MSAPFKYGAHDCSLFAADAILAISGVDVATEYRGLYSTAAEALALIAKVTGGSTVEDCMDDACRKHEFLTALPGVAHAQRGDVVSLQLADGSFSLGVVGLDGKRAWFTGDDELTLVSISRCHRAWHIG
jgi:hypothetical protein